MAIPKQYMALPHEAKQKIELELIKKAENKTEKAHI